jgi:hypothetical protein
MRYRGVVLGVALLLAACGGESAAMPSATAISASASPSFVPMLGNESELDKLTCQSWNAASSDYLVGWAEGLVDGIDASNDPAVQKYQHRDPIDFSGELSATCATRPVAPLRGAIADALIVAAKRPPARPTPK